MKFCFFDTASDDSAVFNAATLSMIDQTGDGTILMSFIGGTLTDGNIKNATVILNVTSGKEMDCMKDISRFIATGRGGVLTIADDTLGAYCSSHITSCGAIALTQ